MIDKILLKLRDRCDEAEVFLSKFNEMNFIARLGKIELAKHSSLTGVGVRAIKKGKMGFAYSTGKNVEGLIKQVMKNMKNAKKVEARLPAKAKYPRKGIVDTKLIDIQPAQAKRAVARILAGSGSEGIKPNKVVLTISFGTHRVMNSLGVDVKNEFTHILAEVEIKYKGVTATDEEASRRLDIDFFDLGKRTAYLAKKSVGGKRIKTGNYPVILNYNAVCKLLCITAQQLSADNVQRGRSPYVKIGERIATRNLTVLDDGTLRNGLFTARSDGEGTRMQKTILIKKGMLKNYMYDMLRAIKASKESTGNAMRSFSSLPVPGPTNFIIKPGRHSLDELIAEIRKGVLVNHLIGAHMSNPVSGDFSVETENTFFIHNGEIKYPLRNVMLSGNVPELLKNIALIANNSRQASEIVSPSILFSKLLVIGG